MNIYIKEILNYFIISTLLRIELDNKLNNLLTF